MIKDEELTHADLKVQLIRAVAVAPVGGAICLAAVCVSVPEILTTGGGFLVTVLGLSLILAWAIVSLNILFEG